VLDKLLAYDVTRFLYSCVSVHQSGQKAVAFLLLDSLINTQQLNCLCGYVIMCILILDFWTAEGWRGKSYYHGWEVPRMLLLGFT